MNIQDCGVELYPNGHEQDCPCVSCDVFHAAEEGISIEEYDRREADYKQSFYGIMDCAGRLAAEIQATPQCLNTDSVTLAT